MAEPTPAKVKRSLYRGNTRRWTHVFEENTGTTGAPVWEPIDITGWTFLTQFREDLNRGTVVCASTTTVTDGPNGIAEEVLSAAQADLLPGQTLPTVKPVVYWDLQSTDTDGNVNTWKYASCPVMGDASDV